MGVTAAVVVATAVAAYTVDSSEKAKKAAAKQRDEANAQQAKVEAGLKQQETKAANNVVRDKARQSQEAKQAEANGRGSTLLTGGSVTGVSDGSAGAVGSGVGAATASGGGKTLLGM